MISFLQGKITGNQNGIVEIMTPGGVGYSVFASLSGIKKWQIGAEVGILTYLSVRENALDLFGFVDPKERELFSRLLSVSGIGPKTALHILSLGSIDEITIAIDRGDIEYLTKVSGIGKKTAERIVVELKNKLGVGILACGGVNENSEVAAVIDGLVALGYSLNEAREAVGGIDATNQTAEQIIKLALKKLNK